MGSLKRILVCLLTAMLCIGMAGCGAGGKDNDPYDGMEFDSLGFKDTAGTYYRFDKNTDALLESESLVFNDDGTFVYNGEETLTGTYDFDTSDYACIIGTVDGEKRFQAWYDWEARSEESTEEPMRMMEVEWVSDGTPDGAGEVVGYFNTPEAATVFGYSAVSKILGTWENSMGASAVADYRTFYEDGTFGSGSPYIDDMEGKQLGTFTVEDGALVCRFDDGHREVFDMVADEVFADDIASLYPQSGSQVIWIPSDTYH